MEDSLRFHNEIVKHSADGIGMTLSLSQYASTLSISGCVTNEIAMEWMSNIGTGSLKLKLEFR